MMLEIYFRYLFFLCLALIITFSSGYLAAKLSGFYSSKTYTSVFCALFAGVCVQVMAYALFFTHGITVMVAMLFVLLLLIWYHNAGNGRQQQNKSIQKKGKMVFAGLAVFLVLLIIYSLKFYFIFHPGGPLLIPNNDTLFHGNVANYLGFSGVEGISLDYLNVTTPTRDPYHYFDLWLNAGIFRVFQLNSLTSYILIVVTLLIVICWCGFMAIAEYFGKVSVITYLLSFFFLFFSGVYLPFYKSISLLENANVFTVDLFSYNKLTVIFIFIQAASLFFIRNKITEGVLMLLILPVVFISTSVSIFAGLFFFIVKKYLREKDIRFLLITGCIYILLALFFFFFYSANEANQTIKIRSVNGGFMSLLTFSYLKTCINIVGLTCIQLLIIYLPVIFFFIFFRKYLLPYVNPLKNDIIFLVVTVFVLSLLSWAALHYILDTVQLFSNISIVMFSCLIFVTMAFIFNKVPVSNQFTVIAILFLIFLLKMNYVFREAKPVDAYTNAYLRQTGKIIKEINPVGVFMFDKKSYTNIFSKNPIFNIAGKHLAYYNSKSYTYSLSVFDTPVSADYPEMDQQMIGRSVFYRYVEKQKLNQQFQTISRSQLEFIKEFKIQYLIAEKGVLLDSALLKIITSAIVDSATGERFYLTDYKKINIQ